MAEKARDEDLLPGKDGLDGMDGGDKDADRDECFDGTRRYWNAERAERQGGGMARSTTMSQPRLNERVSLAAGGVSVNVASSSW